MQQSSRFEHLILQTYPLAQSEQPHLQDEVWITGETYLSGPSECVVAWKGHPTGMNVSVRRVTFIPVTKSGLTATLDAGKVQIIDPAGDFKGYVSDSGNPVSYVQINWGDTGPEDSVTPPFAPVSHTYTAAGLYTVRVHIHYESLEFVMEGRDVSQATRNVSVS